MRKARKKRCWACDNLHAPGDGFTGSVPNGAGSEPVWCCKYCWAISPSAVRGRHPKIEVNLAFALRNGLELLVDEIRGLRRLFRGETSR